MATFLATIPLRRTPATTGVTTAGGDEVERTAQSKSDFFGDKGAELRNNLAPSCRIFASNADAAPGF